MLYLTNDYILQLSGSANITHADRFEQSISWRHLLFLIVGRIVEGLRVGMVVLIVVVDAVVMSSCTTVVITALVVVLSSVLLVVFIISCVVADKVVQSLK